jgi:hypothetical protein
MSKVIAAPPTHAAPGPLPAPAGPLRRVRRIGYVVLGFQLAGFLVWSTILYRRFALTWDFSAYHQAWYLIAHGNLDPYNSIERMPFWRNDSEFAIWPLAPFYWLWPHDMLLLWLQDFGVVAAEAAAFTWICEVAGDRCRERDAAWLAGMGLVLLVANPWMWWAVSFDVHMENLIVLFVVLLARDLANGRRRGWVWAALLLIGGAPSATYVVGIGLGGVLASRRSRLPGAAMVLVGLGYSLFIVLVHGDLGVPLAAHYGYLAAGAGPGSYTHAKLTLAGLITGIAAHPSRVLLTLWAKRVDILANLAAAGLVGFGSLMVLPLILVVLLANDLSGGVLFAEPMFQSLPIYVLLPVGTVMVLGWFARRHRHAALVLAGLLATQTLCWAAVWAPRTPGQWLRVSAPAAATLAGIEARIPHSAEVIASQGVTGRFSSRTDLEALLRSGTIPVTHGETWFVIAPLAGIETLSDATQMALVGELAGPLHATLVTHANGVWAFRWRPPAGVHAITVPDETTPLPAWAAPVAPGAVGRPVITGPVGTWRMTSAIGRGYVSDGLAWQEPPGRYKALVSLSATGPVKVEVWNDTGNVLLARQSVPATTGVESVVLPVDATTPYRAVAYSGWGPFRAEFVPPPKGQRLEVRVWSSGGHTVNIYSAELTTAASGTGLR